LAVAEKISSPEVAKRKHALLQEGGFSCCTITNKLTPNEEPTTCVPMLHRTVLQTILPVIRTQKRTK